MEINDLKAWLEDKIDKYNSVPDVFNEAEFAPAISYELGRYDSYIEVIGLLEK